jgi:hypothetical protein
MNLPNRLISSKIRTHFTKIRCRKSSKISPAPERSHATLSLERLQLLLTPRRIRGERRPCSFPRIPARLTSCRRAPLPAPADGPSWPAPPSFSLQIATSSCSLHKSRRAPPSSPTSCFSCRLPRTCRCLWWNPAPGMQMILEYHIPHRC